MLEQFCLVQIGPIKNVPQRATGLGPARVLAPMGERQRPRWMNKSRGQRQPRGRDSTSLTPLRLPLGNTNTNGAPESLATCRDTLSKPES